MADEHCAEPVYDSCSPDKPTQYELALQQYATTLTANTTTAKATLDHALIDAKTANDSVCIQRQLTDKTATAVREYNFLNNCISVYAQQDVTTLVDTVKADLTLNTTFQTNFTAAVTAIKAAKSAEIKAHTQAQALLDAVQESCNSDERKQIEACLANTVSDTQKQLLETVKEIVKRAQVLNDKADDLSESAVKVAGINAFVNVASLTAFGTDLKTQGTALATDVTKNVTVLGTSYTAAQKALGDVEITLSKAMTARYGAWSAHESLKRTAHFVKKADSCADVAGSIDSLATEAEGSFDGSYCDSPESDD